MTDSSIVDLPTPAMGAVVRSVRRLKRDLLLFEKIHVMGLRWLLGGDAVDRGIEPVDDATAADCEYLVNEGTLVDAPAFRSELSDRLAERIGGEWGDAEPWDGRQALGSLSPVTQGVLLASSARHPAGRLRFDQVMPGGAEVVVAHAESLFETIPLAAALTRPVSRHSWRDIEQTFVMAQPTRSEAPSVVAEVVLPHVPVPDETVPLEAILDFRRETSLQRQLNSLRLWMRRAALLQAPRADLELELETMLHDYKSHMELAEIRTRTSALQLALSVPLGVAQELLHLRPRAAVEALYLVRQSRANQLEAELTAPGREVAYLYSTRSRFDAP